MKHRNFAISCIISFSLVFLISPAICDDSTKIIGNYKLHQMKLNGVSIDINEPIYQIYIQFMKGNKAIFRVDKNMDFVLTKDEIAYENGSYHFFDSAGILSFSNINDAWNGEWVSNITYIPEGFQIQKTDEDGNSIYMLFIRN